MIEPLAPDTISSWVEFLDRFEEEIYPKIFERYGYSRTEAMYIWSNNTLRADIEKVLDILTSEPKEDWE